MRLRHLVPPTGFYRLFVAAALAIGAFNTSSSYACGDTLFIAKTGSMADTDARSSNHYDVLRNGKKIGEHTISFHRQGDALQVTAETHMRVRILFITVFRYHYKSEENWCGNELMAVHTRVDDGGDIQQTQAVRTEDGFRITRMADDQSNEQPADAEDDYIRGTFPSTNHWNMAAIEADHLFNTITGRLNRVEVSLMDTPQPAFNRYAVRGELNINTFYDADGHWRGMAFDHTDGSRIEFRCTACTNTPIGPA